MKLKVLILFAGLIFLLPVASLCSGAVGNSDTHEFPLSQASYNDGDYESIPQILLNRIRTDSFNLIAMIIFFCAVIHTFMASTAY